MRTAYYDSGDHFAVSMLAAIGLHAVVLLGVGFVLDFKPLTHPLETLDVVLVNWRSESAPENAEFLAQAAQQGGGESTETSKPSQEQPASLGPVDGANVLEQQQQSSSVADAAREQILVESEQADQTQQITQIVQPEQSQPSAASLMAESMTMAKLQPQDRRNRRYESKLPRRKWIAANTREYEYAAYMQAWVAKVERIGNLNYPDEVRRLKLVGDLVMTVGIRQDGSVENIEIQRSSGLPQLDQAATRIVRLAAPYSPLPEQINANVDILHITRTWRFSRDFRGVD